MQEQQSEIKPVEMGVSLDLVMRWVRYVGIAAFLFGILYFIKYAFDQGWVGYVGRVAIGAAGALALFVSGHFVSLKERFRSWGLTVAAGGMALAYGTVFFTYVNEAYRSALGLDMAPAASIMTLIVAFGVFYGSWRDSKGFVIASFLLGYLTSWFDSDVTRFSIAYNAALSIAFAGIVAWRRWLHIGFVPILACYLNFIGLGIWNFAGMESFAVVSAAYVAFGLMGIMTAIEIKNPEEGGMHALSHGVNSLFGAALLSMAVPRFGNDGEAIAFVFSVIAAANVLFAFAYGVVGARMARITSTVAAAVSAACAILIYFEGGDAAALMALEAGLIALAARRSQSLGLRYGAFLIMAASAFVGIILASFSTGPSYGNPDVYGPLFVAFAAYAVSYIHDRSLEHGRAFGSAYSWVASSLSFVLVVALVPSQFITVALLALSAALCVAGFFGKQKALFHQAVIIGALVCAKAFAYDIFSYGIVGKMVTFFFLGAALLGVSYLYVKYREKILSLFE